MVPNDHPYWDKMAAESDPAEDAATAIGKAMDRIIERMWTLAATTVAGFAAKARTLRHTQCKSGDSDEAMHEWDWDDECLERFIRDIEIAAAGRASA